MRTGVGIDDRLGLSFEQQRQLVQAAARLGYDSLWTPAQATNRSAFHTCVQWHQATRAVAPEGLAVGISVVPFPAWTVATLAAEAATVGELTNHQFSLGIGLGSYTSAGYRRQLGLPDLPPLALSREYTRVLRDLLAGQRVDFTGKCLELHGAELGIKDSGVKVYLAGMGPRMVRITGEVADGLTPNWSSTEQIAVLRQQLSDAARAAGRDPASVPIAQYIRVCVDEDEDLARRAFVANMLGYAMARPGQPKEQGYRAHFARMGFDEVLNRVEARRDAGTPITELVDEVPAELALQVGYFGKPAGAAAALRKLSAGLDEAMVRLISPRRGDLNGNLAAIEACQPAGWAKTSPAPAATSA